METAGGGGGPEGVSVWALDVGRPGLQVPAPQFPTGRPVAGDPGLRRVPISQTQVAILTRGPLGGSGPPPQSLFCKSKWNRSRRSPAPQGRKKSGDHPSQPCLFPQMPEEEAFCVFVRLMQEYRLRELFKPSMAELGLCIYQFEYMLQVGAGRGWSAPSHPCRPHPQVLN